MTPVVVAAHHVWDQYPGLRVGRLYSGAGALGRHPRGATHVVAGPDAPETVCGRSRADFPHEFEDQVTLARLRTLRRVWADLTRRKFPTVA